MTAKSAKPARSAKAAIAKDADYGDEVTVEQRAGLDRAFVPLKMGKWKVKAGPAW